VRPMGTRTPPLSLIIRCVTVLLMMLTAGGAIYGAPAGPDELARFARDLARAVAKNVPQGSAVGLDTFRVDGGDRVAASLANAVTEACRREFTALRSLKVVETEQLDRILSNLEIQASGAFDASTTAAVGKLVGARYLGLGRVAGVDGRYTVAFRLVTVETGEVLLSDSLELAAGTARELERIYASPKYRVALGAMYIALQPQDIPIVAGTAAFSYDFSLRHSLTLRLAYHGEGRVEDASFDNRLPGEHYQAFTEVLSGFEGAAGYGLLVPVTAFLTLRPYAMGGLTLTQYRVDKVAYNGFDDWEKESITLRGNLYIEGGIEVLVPYANPFGLSLYAGYRLYLFPQEETISHFSRDFTYSEVMYTIVLGGAVRVHF
jgi:TolB-like protein